MFVINTPIASITSPQSPGVSTVKKLRAMALLQHDATVVDEVLEVLVLDVEDEELVEDVEEVEVVDVEEVEVLDVVVA